MSEQDDILLSRYLAGELTTKEFQDFEDRLPRDPGMKYALKQRRREQAFLKTEAQLPDLKARMEALSSTHFQEKKQAPAATVRQLPKTKTSRRWIPYAALATAAALTLLIWNPFSQPTDDYRQYTNYPTLALTEKSTNASSAAAAETAFNQQDYGTAYTQLSTYLAANPNDNEARLALGIAALESDRNAEATDIFKELARGTSVFAYDGRFYLVLTYLKTKDYDRFQEVLATMDENNPDYGVRIRKLRELEEE